MSTSPDPDAAPRGVPTSLAKGREERPEGDPGGAVQTQLRGSGLLLGGRFVAIGLNFLVTVLIVRSLTRADYGSFSFALSATALAANVNLLGLARAMSRMGPLYGEQRDASDLVRAIIAALGAVVSFGVLLVGAAYLGAGTWQPWMTDQALSQELLLLLVVLTPLTAIDAVLEVLSAAFAGARAIFFRRHLMTPLLRLGAVVTVMSLGAGPKALAWGYIGAAVIGLLAYAGVLHRALRERGARWVRPNWEVSKPVLGYGLSMALLDWAGVSILHLPAVTLEWMRGSTAVAGLRAVVPLATLVLVVFQSLKLLYVPLATRSYERGGRAQLTEAYWAAAKWIGLLSYPIFAVSVFLSPWVVTFLFGKRYADASSLAAIMAVGYYLHAILGVNTLTLQALGESRSLRVVALAGIATAVVANAALIPLWGAVGAAIATTLTLLAHDLTNAYLLWKCGHVGGAPADFFRPYAWVLGVTLALLISVTCAHPPLWLAVTLVALGILAVWQATRRSLRLLETFPELGKIPGMRFLLS